MIVAEQGSSGRDQPSAYVGSAHRPTAPPLHRKCGRATFASALTPDHGKDHVQDYLQEFCPEWTPERAAVAFRTVGKKRQRVAPDGSRKVEANALVVRPEAAERLFRKTVLRYLPADAPARYEASLQGPREEMRATLLRRLRDIGG